MDHDTRIDLKNFNLEELTEFLAGMGKERFRAGQVMRWMYGRLVDDFDAMSDLSKVLRAELQQRTRISRLVPEATEESRDGTRKYLFRLEDKETIESVRIPTGLPCAFLPRSVVPWGVFSAIPAALVWCAT